MILHPAGQPPILRLLSVSVLLLLFGNWCGECAPLLPSWLFRLAGTLAFVASLFLMWFYRDPERQTEAPTEALLCGADGKVIQILQRDYLPELDGPGTQISVFMNPLNVHVNRAAMAGRVARVDYRPGRYLMAFHEKSSELNEACLLVLEDGRGRRTAQRQIAGFLARRVVCTAQEGQELARGQRYGIIKLGSRMDHFLPAGVKVRVKRGDRVRAGQTILGEWT